jgi:predicted nuclease of predicted toxin-antitoxin system
MSLRLVVDMNLSPEWIPWLMQRGWTAVHWSTIGDPKANDAAIMSWALARGYAVVVIEQTKRRVRVLPL